MMERQVKRSPEEKLREYQRKKYMGFQERIKDDADWREGINQFRLRVQEELDGMKRKIDELTSKIEGDSNDIL